MGRMSVGRESKMGTLEVEGAGEAAGAALTCEVTKRGRKQESATG
jgi:hypothetical protein